MTEPRRIGSELQSFDDLAVLGEEMMRQLATRVHIIDLAYAFRDADETLREHLLSSVRPALADEIRSAFRAVETESERFPSEEAIRSARARVVELARSVLMGEV